MLLDYKYNKLVCLALNKKIQDKDYKQAVIYLIDNLDPGVSDILQ